MLRSFAENFRNKVVGVDININFDHEGREAASWIKEVFLSHDETVLLGVVKWTPKGALSLSGLEFRYFSPEFTLNFVHPHTGVEHGPTLTGGALVNQPFLKMDAIVGLSNKGEGMSKNTDTIALSEHESAVAKLEKEIAGFKLSENVATTAIKNQKDEITKLSDAMKVLTDAASKKETEDKNRKLFDDGKISDAQLKALNEGKDIHDVLALSEKLTTRPKGSGDGNETVALSDGEKDMAKKLGMSDEDFTKYSKEGRN